MKRNTKEAIVVCAAAGMGLAAGWFSAKPGAEDHDVTSALAERAGGKSMRAHGSVGGNRESGRSPTEAGKIDAEFLDWMRGASVGELRQAVLEAFRTRGGRGSFRAHVILQDLVQKNPLETYEFFRAREPRQSGLVTAVFQVWASIDPHAATEQVVKHAALAGYNDRGEVSTCFGSLARVDLQSALAFADKLTPHRRDDAYEALLRGYSSGAPEDMSRVFDLVEKKGIRARYALTNWAASDPEGAIEWLRTRGKGKTDAACYLANGLASADPERAMTIYHEFNGLEDGPNYSGVAASVLGQWMKKDYRAALAWIEGKGTEIRRRVLLKGAFQNLVSLDSEVALEHLLSGDASAASHLNWTSVIGNLASKKTEGEMLALLERTPDDMKPAVRDALMAAGFIEASPDVLAELAGGGEGGHVYGAAIRSMLVRNPESFSTLLKHVAEDKRGEVIRNLGQTVAASSPEAVLEAVGELQDPALFEENGAQFAIASLAHSRPEAAMRAVENLPEGKPREYGAQTLVMNLRAHDLEGALEWLNRQRDSMSGEAIWNVAAQLRYSTGEKERIEEMFGDLKPDEKKGKGAGAGGGAIIGGSIGN